MSKAEERALEKYPLMSNNDKEGLEALKYIGMECEDTSVFNRIQEAKQAYFVEGYHQAEKEIQEEPVSEDLEEASRNYADNEEYGDDVYFAIEAAFKAGAKWQREQMQYKENLEVKEVDLEKELSYEDYKSFFEKYPDLSDDWGFDETWTCAKYFFELGLKAQKENKI